jgi:hypothetical protein
MRKTLLAHMIHHNHTVPQLVRPVRGTFVSSMKMPAVEYGRAARSNRGTIMRAFGRMEV